MCNYVFISFTTLYKKNGDITKKSTCTNSSAL